MTTETQTITSSTTPLLDALHAAIAAEAAADVLYHSDDVPARGPEYDAWVAAEAVIDAAREALLASVEPRSYTLRDGDSGTDDEITATSPKEARKQAREWIRGGDYGEIESTIWVDVYIAGEDGTDECLTVSIDPDEPDCTEDEHDWQSPIEIVGGIKENPGVWGHGGGIIATEVCMHCGCKRVTDTWAQRLDNGEQGLTSVEYEAGAFADELAAGRADESREDAEQALMADDGDDGDPQTEDGVDE